MPRIGLTQVINSDFLNRFTGLARGSSTSSIKKALQGGTSVSLSDGLRIGARTFATAVQNLNSVVSFVNLSRSTLEDLGGLVDKMISLADEASKARTSTQKRKALDREFQKLGNDFV
ncbi:MAG: hypothetical protein D6719_03505, partial [Candidatus Dadabacteria bacterium]